GDQPHARKVARPAADGDQPPPHAVTDLVAGVAVDEDLAPRHALEAPTVDSADKVAGRAADMNAPAVHLRPQPVACVAADEDLAARHVGPSVHAGVAFDADRAGGQVCADELDLGAV